ncbi:MAG: hypothetical protein JNK74_26220 [Candidatus Hydrogenedentes bacterium]|nr:hypothetical protein [Candidatus Hydrogenedentota bacterium]
MQRSLKFATLAGLICVILLAPGIKFFRNARHALERAQCRENLQTLGVKLAKNAEELAAELKGTYPPMSREANKLMFTTEGLLPKCIPAPELLVCPSRASQGMPQEFDDGSYFYTGYVLAERGFVPPSGWPFMADISYPVSYYTFDNLLPAFAAFYDNQIASAGSFKERFVREGEIDIYRLTEGVEHGYERTVDCVGDDVQKDVKISRGAIPVLIEWPDNIHSSERLGGNVLWLDGQVTWLPYPGEFPMTEEGMAIFTKLAGRPPIGQLE